MSRKFALTRLAPLSDNTEIQISHFPAPRTYLWQPDDFFTFSNPPLRKPHQTANMGRVRTKTVKKSAKVIIERYYPKLTLDFETNKRICDEIAIIASKRLRNKVGF